MESNLDPNAVVAVDVVEPSETRGTDVNHWRYRTGYSSSAFGGESSC
jgi:hypothetical protein